MVREKRERERKAAKDWARIVPCYYQIPFIYCFFPSYYSVSIVSCASGQQVVEIRELVIEKLFEAS